MKSIAHTLLLLMVSFSIIAQQPQYQTYTAVMKIKAFKEGEQFEWENKDISVRLDYKTGGFITRLTNRDFQETGTAAPVVADSTGQELEYTFTGIFPVNDIINQKQINRHYTVELMMDNEDLRLRESILFDMKITRPGSGQSNTYRVFSLHGKLYNDQLNLPAVKDFDDEVEVWLLFNGFMNTR